MNVKFTQFFTITPILTKNALKIVKICINIKSSVCSKRKFNPSPENVTQPQVSMI